MCQEKGAKRLRPRVVLFFVDGLGVGERDAVRNPLANLLDGHLSLFADSAFPHRVRNGGLSTGIDAALGVDGIPQSATGQTTLLTGVNAPRLLGRHLFGFPNRALREVIMERSLLKTVRERGLKCAFLNAFRPRFFELGKKVWKKPLSVTTWTNGAAALPFFTLDDVAARRSIYQDFTNRSLRERGFDVPLFSPEEAGGILGRRSEDFDFLLYEYFRTDGAGHSCDMGRCVSELEGLERFLEAALRSIDLDSTLVILTSDHGNIEDLGFKGHTRNPALTALWGRGAAEAIERLQTIQDVPRVILDTLKS